MAQMIIFGKERMAEGRKFDAYFTRLTNSKTGEIKVFNVKFRQCCGNPDISFCPCIIDVPDEKRNLSEKAMFKKDSGEPLYNGDGSIKVSRTIWISEWVMVGPYVDHSLDDWE